ncbi:putative inactive peptidyl-prolyl cis-trans isomerase-like 6 isoform X2 [Lasioglossum baleicum]|uniref:putative inactive peptidyl-prolyl cis-trans isomerase-like 6 isoform X2 n=1 Tax=Lasioglossum baleicum TaxID=434251 RepID=UPI003FCCED4F
MIQNGIKTYYYSNLIEIDRIRLKVVGILNTVAFQKARICAEKLYQHLPLKFASPQIVEMFQVDWHEYIKKRKKEIGGEMWQLTRTVAVFINDEFLGSDKEFIRYISESYVFSLPIGTQYYEDIALEQCKLFMEKSKRKYVYFTFTIDSRTIGSFMFMLYSDLLPLTCQYFLNHCIGYDAVAKCYGDSYYVNTRVHRIVKNGWIQCGGIASPDDKTTFEDHTITIPDESYCISHDRRGVLSMVNDGKHCNQPEFFVCLKPNLWMNYYYVAFGQLVDGIKTLENLEKISTYFERPSKDVVISDCGEYIFVDEPRLETESRIFLKHVPICTEEENMKYVDSGFDLYSITSWLDNVVDKIDVRDTASVLMTERYLNGLYCLVSDYEPGMDMRVHEEIHLIPKDSTESMTETMLQQLLMQFHPNQVTKEEKLMFISQISKIILAYLFCYENNRFCLKHISIGTREAIHKILEVAHKIALKAVAKSEISQKCNDVKIVKIIETKKIDSNILISHDCISLLQSILNEAILCFVRSFDIQE